MKICIDAGHYGKYNRSPANNKYYESDVMWKLHLLQKKYLEEYGFEVLITRSNQNTDKSLYNRGAMSKGCDLFISNHSNAVGSVTNNNVDYPVVIVPLNKKGNTIGQRLVECVEKVMGTTQKGRVTTRAYNGKDYYGVIRGAVAVGTVGLIIEHSFHTHKRSTDWLLNDDNLEKLAKAEADVIADYFGVAKQKEFKIRVSIDNLNVRLGAGLSYGKNGYCPKGVYTIVDTQNKDGYEWGKLKSGIGWVALKYTERL